MAKERPVGVTILAFLAILGAINALIYTLQMLHLLPTFLGPIAFYQFSLIGAFFWGLLFFIWLAVLPDALGSPAPGMDVHGSDCCF